MSTDKGYIKLYREIRDHWIWSNGDYLKAWLDLIMMMNHEDTKVMYDKSLITVKRGSRITSIRKLAERWGWSRNRVKRFLDILESDGMIATERDTKKTTITVIKYGFYQGQDRKSGTQMKPQTEPQMKPQTEPQTEHREIMIERMNKNEKEEASPVLLDNDDDDGMTPEEYMRRKEAGEFDDI